MRCQNCGADAPTRYVVFSQNIGLFVLRFPSSVEGAFCKQCIHRFFWKMTLTSMVMGWWGIISFFTNLYFIFNNIVTYVGCLGMQAGGGLPGDWKAPAESVEPVSFADERIALHHDEMARLLADGESLATICERVAQRACVPESDVEEYILKHLSDAAASLG